jgi:moderate conductance mechanosensitive channel
MGLDNSFIQIVATIAVVVLTQIIIRDSLGRIVRNVVKSHKYESKAEEHKREDTLIRVFRTLSAVVLWTVGIIVILGELHVHLATLLTGAGLIGVVVGLGAQNMMKDYLAGILIIMENQFRVGDIVSMSAGLGTPVAGVVEDISIRATRLRDLDGNLHIVPNGSAGIITNLSYKFAQVNVDVNVAYDTDIDKVELIINEIGEQMTHDEAWTDRIIEPIKFMQVSNFGDSALVVKAVGKVKPAAQWDVASAFRRRVVSAFKKNGIEIALPQIVVHQPLKK